MDEEQFEQPFQAMIIIALAATVAKLKGWPRDSFWAAARDEQGRVRWVNGPRVGATVEEVVDELAKNPEFVELASKLGKKP
jgi:hypothetical protein